MPTHRDIGDIYWVKLGKKRSKRNQNSVQRLWYSEYKIIIVSKYNLLENKDDSYVIFVLGSQMVKIHR